MEGTVPDAYSTVSLTVQQVQEALSAENLYYAGQKLGHTPSTREALVYFIDQLRYPQSAREYIVQQQAEVFEPYPLQIEPFVCVECGQSGSCHHHH